MAISSCHRSSARRHDLVALLLALIALFPVSARAQQFYDYIYPVLNFTSSVPGGQSATTGDRFFTSTAFSGGQVGYTFNASNVGHFDDGRLMFGPSVTSPTVTYNWNDWVPADLGGFDNNLWDPDRGDTATAYADEPGLHVRLNEVVTTGNISRVFDGELGSSGTNAYLQLYFGNGSYLQSDGVYNTPELVLLERGANSGVWVRAIRDNHTYTDAISVNFRTSGSTYDSRSGLNVPGKGGSTGFSLDTLEINSAQSVSGVGVDLRAFGITNTTDRIIGYEIWFDGGNTFTNGPDIHGFFLSREPTPVPEGSSLLALSGFLAGGGGFLRYRLSRKRPSKA